MPLWPAQVENRLNEGAELAVVDDLSDVARHRPSGLTPIIVRARFSGRGLAAAPRSAPRESAFLEDGERSPLRISAHRVEHNVHVANVIFKARRLVVNRFVAAEFSDQIDVFGAGSGADHSCAVRLCELHRHRPDSAGRRVDKHRLPRAQFRGVKQRLVRRQRADGYGRRAGNRVSRA